MRITQWSWAKIRRRFHRHTWDIVERSRIRRTYSSGRTTYGLGIIRRCSDPECFKEHAYFDFGNGKESTSVEFLRYGMETVDLSEHK